MRLIERKVKKFASIPFNPSLSRAKPRSPGEWPLKRCVGLTLIYLLYYIVQAANEITSIAGIDRLENLTLLHVRENQIQTLDGFSEKLKHLQYINLRYSMFHILFVVATSLLLALIHSN